MKYERGSTLIILLIVGAVILTIIGGMVWQISRLEIQNKAIQESLTKAETERDAAVNLNEKKELEAKTLAQEVQDGKNLVKEYVAKNDILEKRVDALTSKLPKAKPKSPDTVDDPELEARSLARITTLWEVYCLDEQSLECKPEVKT